MLNSNLTDLGKSVSDGKTLVANAITAKGVTTATNASFATMASNIGSINTGSPYGQYINVSGATVQMQLKDGSWWTVSNAGLPATFSGTIASYSEGRYNDSAHKLGSPSSTHQLYSQYLSYSNGNFRVLKTCYLSLNMSASQRETSQGCAVGQICINNSVVRSYTLGNSYGNTSGTSWVGTLGAGSTFYFYNSNTSGYPQSAYSIGLTVS